MEEGLEMGEGREGAEFEVGSGGGEGFEVLEEQLVCAFVSQRWLERTLASSSHSPSGSSFSSRRTKSVSTLAAPRSSFRFFFSSTALVSSVPKSKRWLVPGRVGRKKGARSGALGASLGLFRCFRGQTASASAIGVQEGAGTNLNRLQVEQRLPARPRHERKREQSLGELVGRGVGLNVLPADRSCKSREGCTRSI